MLKKLPLSLIIIARNEEKKIAQCLNSVAPWVEEIICVINNCTDNTQAIMLSYGAKVFEESWSGFTDQKNKALNYASQPWILSLDADEEISPHLARSIQSFFYSSDKDNYEGAYWARRTWFLGRWIKHGDWYPDHVLRLFRREKGRFVGGKVHEKIVLEGKSKKLQGDLLHYSFDNINHMSTKFISYGDAFLQDKLDKNLLKFSSTKTVLRSLWRFFRCYIIRLGFLDGYAGFYIAINQGFHALFRYTRLYENKIIHAKPTLRKCDF
ncbi:MAG: glycosyltransferase family 2 protein [Verrucomicrobia bacterium]|nr:MAG: glycosyltransferase family 2 protein [Verrucomicrobiota bacterium]